MARDTESLKIAKWADSGDRTTPEDDGLTRATGFPSSYSQANGDVPSREVENQFRREITGALVDIFLHGILEWDSAQDYTHPAIVWGSDNVLYVSVQDSGPSSTAQDPTSDTADTYWAAFTVTSLPASSITTGTIATARLPKASTTQEGIKELGTTSEINSGTPTGRLVTVDGLKASRYRQNWISTSTPTGSDGEDGDTWDVYTA